MRMMRHYVINKNTNKAIYTNCNRSKCVEFMNALEDKENYTIGYKWLSI